MTLSLGFFASQPTVNTTDLDLLNPNDNSLAKLDSRLDAVDELVKRSKRIGIAEPVQIVISELELSSKFSDWSTTRDDQIVKFSDSRAAMKANELIFVGLVKLAGQEFHYRADILLRIEAAEFHLEIRRFQIGQLFTPRLLRAAVSKLISLSIEAGLPRSPIDIETLLISERGLVISGATIGI